MSLGAHGDGAWSVLNQSGTRPMMRWRGVADWSQRYAPGPYRPVDDHFGGPPGEPGNDTLAVHVGRGTEDHVPGAPARVGQDPIRSWKCGRRAGRPPAARAQRPSNADQCARRDTVGPSGSLCCRPPTSLDDQGCRPVMEGELQSFSPRRNDGASTARWSRASIWDQPT